MKHSFLLLMLLFLVKAGIAQNKTTFLHDVKGNMTSIQYSGALQCVQLPVVITKTDVLCYGKSTGSVTVTAPTGNGTYTFRLGTTGVFSTTNTFLNLKAGNYVVNSKDGGGSVTINNVTITQPSSSIVPTFTKADETCPGAKNGSITVNASGGAPPYRYRYGASGSYTPTNTFNNLAAGSYRIYIIDTGGCNIYSVAVAVARTSTTCFSQSMITKNGNIKAGNGILEATLSPNPSNGLFNLNVSGAVNNIPVQVTVWDVNGKNLYSKTGSSQQTFRFGEQFNSGTYFVEVRQGEQVKTLKAIKIFN